jgi:hypothetical protein
MDYRNQFDIMYQDTWQPHVILGNIKSRTFETSCKCHPNILEEIVLDYLKDDNDMSKAIILCGEFEYNKPMCMDYEILPDGCDRILWMVSKLQDVYECAVCGYPCFENVKNVHEIFWSSKFTDEEREAVRTFCATKPSIRTVLKGGRVHNFNWCGGWSAFSLTMCGLFQLSFDVKM